MHYNVLETTQSPPFPYRFAGTMLRLINATNSVQTFEAPNSRLNIVQEAMDKDGKWRPIEYPTSSWSDESYHSLGLGANEYWSFVIPRYIGSFATKMRVRFSQKDITLLSNEFPGSINPEQFPGPLISPRRVLPQLDEPKPAPK